MIALFRPSRETSKHDPHLHVKMILFALGAGFGVAGIAMDSEWLVYIAMVLLAAGLLLRFRRPRDEPTEDAAQETTDGPAGDAQEEMKSRTQEPRE